MTKWDPHILENETNQKIPGASTQLLPKAINKRLMSSTSCHLPDAHLGLHANSWLVNMWKTSSTDKLNDLSSCYTKGQTDYTPWLQYPNGGWRWNVESHDRKRGGLGNCYDNRFLLLMCWPPVSHNQTFSLSKQWNTQIIPSPDRETTEMYTSHTSSPVDDWKNHQLYMLKLGIQIGICRHVKQLVTWKFDWSKCGCQASSCDANQCPTNHRKVDIHSEDCMQSCNRNHQTHRKMPVRLARCPKKFTSFHTRVWWTVSNIKPAFQAPSPSLGNWNKGVYLLLTSSPSTWWQCFRRF